MKYISTRGQSPAVGFGAALTQGLAPDGGLYVPEAWPTIPLAAFDGAAGLVATSNPAGLDMDAALVLVDTVITDPTIVATRASVGAVREAPTRMASIASGAPETPRASSA